MTDLFCEGIAGGLDVRLIEFALFEIQRSDVRASRIRVLPAGSKGAVAAVVKAMRSVRPTVGVCDRDYRPAWLLRQHREGVEQKGQFPLSRHCIESYLVEPALLLGLGVWSIAEAEAVLTEEAERLVWDCAAMGVVERYNRQHHRQLSVPSATGLISRSQVVESVGRELNTLRDDVERFSAGFDIGIAVDELVQDFQDDGPQWTRVDGKKLAKRVSVRLGKAVPRGGLAKWTLAQIEAGKAEVPGALLDDLMALLDTL